jgi:hypothetical protein
MGLKNFYHSGVITLERCLTPLERFMDLMWVEVGLGLDIVQHQVVEAFLDHL